MARAANGNDRMNWVAQTSPIQAGDRVAYSRRFLQSIACYTGDLPFARGTVKSIRTVGELRLADIDWGNPDIPETVNVANLAKVTERGVLDRGL